MKTCNRCGEVKAKSEFYAHFCKCKVCTNVERRAKYAKDRERRNAATAQYRAANRELVRARDRKRNEVRNKLPENSALSGAAAATRRAQELGCVTHWDPELDRLVLQEAYRLAKLRTKVTGVQWSVDHIVPMKNPLVCGLHNAYSIQVITLRANHQKRNHFEV